MSWCISDKIIQELKKEFDPNSKDTQTKLDSLFAMDDKQRHEYFKKWLNEENTTRLNADFERRMLKGDSEEIRIKAENSFLEQIKHLGDKPERIDEYIKDNPDIFKPKSEQLFHNDLANVILGIDVSMHETKRLTKIANIIESRREAGENDVEGGTKRLEYAAAMELFNRYSGKLESQAKEIPLSLANAVDHPLHWIGKVTSATKNLKSTGDNSFWGRQGLFTLITHPSMWTKRFLQSFSDFGKELIGINAMTPAKVEILGRDNNINGKFKALGLEKDLNLRGEEEFVEGSVNKFIHKIPILGQLHKASSTAFNAGALKLRADWADMLIREAEKGENDVFGMGQEALNLGYIASAMTGRGNLGKYQGELINTTFFSVRYLKSLYDVIAMPFKNASEWGKITEGYDKIPASKRIAAENLLKIVVAIGGFNAIASYMYPNSFQSDPRDSLYGKFKIGNTTIDFTGGFGSLLTLALRIIPTIHNGKWGSWKVNNNGVYQRTSISMGSTGPIDLIVRFFEGKLSPTMGMVRDLSSGKEFSGKPISPLGITSNLVTPMPIQTGIDLWKDKTHGNYLADILSMILSEGGLGVSTYDRKRLSTQQINKKERALLKNEYRAEKKAKKKYSIY